jgi:prophage regulatory protein
MHTAFSSPSSAPATPVMPSLMDSGALYPPARSDASVRPVPSTIYDLISREAFPKQISAGGKCSVGAL